MTEIQNNKQPRLLHYQNKWMSILLEKEYLTELRIFDFEMYSEFWRIIPEEGLALWLDSETFSRHQDFETIQSYYDEFFPSESSGCMPKWTHPAYLYYNSLDKILMNNE
ncbi:12093_t:CDS:2 [Entrophospora sp. SA101]|nr:12093_t:CDS:2 [Entrophospora sp. SA101]